MSAVSAIPGLAAPSPTCRAPHVALRFSPDGHVHACCVNDTFPLGQIGRQSIRQIWEGPRADELRDSLDRADYRHGCQDCEADYLLGERLQTHAEQFDRFPQPAAPLAWPLRVEFALSNTCNLQCVQCNGDLSSAIRAQREHRPPLPSPYGDAFFDELRDLLPHVEVAVFIGGEPFLARECRRVWDLLIELDLHPEVHVTTNGTVWDGRVERYLHALQMNVAVSIDGFSDTVNDTIRAGSAFHEVIANRDRFLAATRSYGGGFCLNHCLLRDNWHELGDFLLEADRLDVDVHVIPVHYPPHLSLFTMPGPQLDEVAGALAASPSSHRVVRNRHVWDGIVAHVRARQAASEQRSAVSVRTGPLLAPDDRLVATVRAELATWACQAPVTIRAPGGIIDEIDSPAWAEALDLGRFVGGSLEELEAVTSDELGPRHDLRTEPGGDGFTWMSYAHWVSGERVAFRTAMIPGWGVVTATRSPRLLLPATGDAVRVE